MFMRWNEPAKIDAPISGNVVVNGPFEPLTIMLDEWPDLRGRTDFVKARSLCRAAVAGRKDPEEARAIFINVAKEATSSIEHTGRRIFFFHPLTRKCTPFYHFLVPVIDRRTLRPYRRRKLRERPSAAEAQWWYPALSGARVPR